MNLQRGARFFFFSLCILLAASHGARGQQSPIPASHNVTPKPEDVKTPPNPAADPPAGIRIRVKNAEGKPIPRKRFYLLTSSAEKSGLDWAAVPVREAFLKSASAELRKWVEQYDCDTIYCPEFEAEFEAAKETVPEFKQAYAEGLRRYKNPRLALRWLTVNFPVKEARLGYYESKKKWLDAAARKTGAVASVMTDEKGEAYFVGVKTGSYYVSNLIPLGIGNFIWDAPVTVPPLLPGKLHSASVELNAKPR
jgi:hypothetical protein